MASSLSFILDGNGHFRTVDIAVDDIDISDFGLVF